MRLGWAVLFAASLLACKHPPATTKPAVAEPAAVAESASKESAPTVIEVTAADVPPTVERLLVPGDLLASVVRGTTTKPPLTVFMAGMCSNAMAYLQNFPQAAQKQGGMVAIEGDQLCGPGVDPSYRTYSWDANKQHARIEAALAAAGVTEIPKEGLTLVGYSQGAAIAEQLAAKYPQRYARLLIIGAPTDPQPRNFAKTRAVVTMACSRDIALPRMKTAAKATNKIGTPATYFQMPDCIHGQVADAENVFGQSFDWLAANERTLSPEAAAASPVRIVGPPS